MPDLDIVGGAAVDVVPVIPQFHTKLKALVLPIADKVGEEAGRKMGEAISKNIVLSIPQAITQGGKLGVRAAGKQGDDAGGAFARSIRRKLEAAFKAMPKLDVKLGDTGVDADLARIRAKLEQLSNKRIGIDVSAEAAEAEITRLEARLRELGAQHPNVAVRADTATARAALAEIRAEIAAIGGRRTVALEVDGSFGARLRAAVQQAQESLPEINVDADTTPARAEIQDLRTRLAALSEVRVGIDMDAATAMAEIDAIQARLAVLSAQTADIDVRVDAGAAAAQLAALRALADDKTFNIHALADTAGASQALLALAAQAAALVAIPLGPVLAAGLGAVVSMATAAAVGVGAVGLAAIPAIKGVTEAIKAKTAAEKEATTATDDSARKGVQAAQRALQMAGAQASLASAHRNAARAIAQANRQVEDAERALAQAGARAMDQRRQAAESVERAERSLADAQHAARQAEQDLTQARKDATAQLADLNDQLADGALDQREATLRVQQAQEDLNRTLADAAVGKATQLQVDAAQLAYDRAKQNQKEQAESFAELKKSAAAQKKAGVEGSEAVKAAHERLAGAQRDVSDNAKALVDAQRAAARAQVDAAQAVADAQRNLADAVQNAADAQVSASEQIEAAERGVESARLSGIDTTAKAITKQDEYRKALAKLSPEARDLFDAIAGPKGITTAFKAWSRELSPSILPLFTRTVESAKNSLPGLTPIALGAAAGIGTLMDKASAQLKTPFWVSFKAELEESVEPAVVGFGVSFGRVVEGIAGIIDAFLPHMDGIARHSDRITERFAKWGTSLKGSPDFERFLKYVKDTSPGLAEFLGDVMEAALDVTKTLAPLSEALFDVVGPLFKAISWLAENCPEFVQTLWLLYAAQKAITLGMAAFAGAMVLYESVMVIATIATAGWAVALNATGIVPIIRAIILVVGLLGAGIVLLYKNSETFRTIVDAAWHGIKTTVSFVWNTILKPIFDAMAAGIRAIIDAAMWLWDNAIGPVFGLIGGAAKLLFKALVVAALIPAYIAFKVLAEIVMWLWDHAIGPVFGWIADKATWLWESKLRVAWDAIKIGLESLGRKFELLWEGCRPVLQKLGDKAEWLYDDAIRPMSENIDNAMSHVADAFESAKRSIERSWSQVKDVVREPVRFVIEEVYNAGIVPLWNNVVKIAGGDKLRTLDISGFYTGGIIPGYSPGVDDRVIAVGGGEAILRPEVTRALGAAPINSWNAAARQGGVGAVRRAISDGMPAFASGGIVGDIWGALKSVGGSVVDGIKDTTGLLLNPDKVFSEAGEWATAMMSPFTSSAWGTAVSKLPVKMLKSLGNSIFGGDGTAKGSVGKALAWAKTQDPKPYVWGGTGPDGFDCSGFMSSIQKVIMGQNPHGRLWSTFSFQGDNAPAGWVRNLKSPFMVGITNQGVGHTAGTLAGVNVESRGGDGVVIGPQARGWADSLFTSHYGFAPAIGKVKGYAAGGFPGVGETAWVGENGPELLEFLTPTRVYSHADSMAMARATQSIPARQTSTPTIQADVHVYVGDREITDIVRVEVDAREAFTAADLETGRYL
ncbi:hypothetical protein CP967_31135 [Streptomyces nitrosporeus]|uniref:NlpC/P60 domain-containing protein n=1 Tax=Streptomyces nitrosporeus TaxID=28894 RepID=A0A5J6FJ37_9ACTN|nr:NlpC/P60 family protein [Streptomyces nitrosporeus]QEU75827.1 hypothetical protein CP967_31135 [Streptomyces nitrosporeus]GGY88578.1 hypothetical protein GCM10010327_19120 [Streptomyces nitrosporeus]